MEDLRGVSDEIGGVARNWKPIAIVIAGLAVVGLLGYLALSIVTAPAISMSFEDKTVKAGGNTLLDVVVVNTGETDAMNVVVSVTPESAVVGVTNPMRSELVIGSKAKREFKFPITVSSAATPGTYRIMAKASNISNREEVAVGYLEVE